MIGTTEFLIALWAAERFLICVGSFMGLQSNSLTELLFTLWTAEWFLIVCILSWVFKSHEWLNFLSHFEQLNGFSPVWILSWQSSLLLEVKALPHLEQLIGLLKVLQLSPVFPGSSQLISLLMASSSCNALWISISSWAVSDSMVNLLLKLTEL